jgi:hypothetical protein
MQVVSNRPRPLPSTGFTTIRIHESFYLAKESASVHQSTEEVRNMCSYATIPHRPSWRGAHFSTGAAILKVLRLLKRAVSVKRETEPL